MSQENVEIVRRAIAAFARRDLDALVAEMSPDCEVIALRSERRQV